ncbi:unnamed protein product [Caenorhabditis angaria]|uniref:Uncharacterized protein n=1 Tax=Caenorhabditis angaria TaxID=860376 RepID=A0A9P1IHP5_9PELO|nr:unnamed protein product [Caenorhabditis angaria]
MWWCPFLVTFIFSIANSQNTYEAIPIGQPYLRPLLSPRAEPDVPPPPPPPHIRPQQHQPRGYQPPPRLANFNPPRSFVRPPPQPQYFQPPSFRAPSLNLNQRPRNFQNPSNWQMQQLQQQHPQRFANPVGAPGQIPRFQGGRVDPVNNIIIHLYLNAKDKMSHTAIKTPVKGLFGIGTSHGGPGSHTDPIVITKDFDRDTLEFVEAERADKMVKRDNIIEVKATVSTPNRQLENSVNRAVNQELNRAIPKVMDRMKGSSTTEMDNDMRKELEDALVDELARNLGESIDNADVTEEDLSKLIEEGFNEITNGESTTRSRPPATTTTRRVFTTTSQPTTTTQSTTTFRPTTTTRQSTISTSTTTTTTSRPTTTTREETTTESTSNHVTAANIDDDYSSEDISQTTTRIILTTSTSPTPTPTTRYYTQNHITSTTYEHVRIVPGIRVTEAVPSTISTTTERPTTTRYIPPTPTTRYEPPTTTTTTTQRATTTTETEPEPTVIIKWSEEKTTATVPIPTRSTPIQVQPSVIPHHGVVNLGSSEEEIDYTAITPPNFEFSTPKSTAISNLPTKSAPSLHPSTFSPPLVTEESSTTPDKWATAWPKDYWVTRQHNTASSNDITETTPSSTPAVITSTYTTTFVPITSTSVTVPVIISESTEEPFSTGAFSESTELPFTWQTSVSEETTTPTLTPVQITKPHQSILDMMRTPFDFNNIAFTDITHPTFRPVISLEDDETQTTTNSPNISTEKPSSSSEEIQPNVILQNGQCPTPNQISDQNRTDVLFLLDSSDSFNEEKFHRAIELISDTVKQFNNFGSDGVQVSLVQYNDEPYLEFSLRKHNCKKNLLDDISDTEYMTGGSQLGKALSKVSQFAFTKKRGDREDAENVLIIVTDGQSDDRVQQPIRLAKDNNVTVLVISTIGANKEYLNELANNRNANIFELDDDPNQQLSYKLARRIALATKRATTVPTPIGTVNDVVHESTNIPTIAPKKLPDQVVNLECVSDGFQIKIKPPPGFHGVATVKGYQDDVKCKTTATGEANMFISNEECGVTQVKSMSPSGLNSSLVLHLLHDDRLNTAYDRAYLLQCFVGTAEDTEVSTNLNVIRSELTIAETISLSTLPPTCAYSIRKDTPNGPIVTKAKVGDTVYHRWDCDGSNETSNAYGIQVHSCYASDDVERKFAFVDPRGCSSDLALLSDLTYDDGALSAYAASHVFSVHNADSLKFVCKLSLCTRDGDGCEGVTPPACGNSPNRSDILLTRRLVRNQMTAIDDALTSALTTKVGVSVNSAEGVKSILSALVSNQIFWIVAVLSILAVIGISIFSRRNMDSTDSATTCSDPSSMSDSQDLRSCHSAETAPNNRLAEFMRTFDRNRYV